MEKVMFKHTISFLADMSAKGGRKKLNFLGDMSIKKY